MRRLLGPVLALLLCAAVAPGALARAADTPPGVVNGQGTVTRAAAATTYRGFVWRDTASFYDQVKATGPDCADCVWSVTDACSEKLPTQDQAPCIGGQLNCPPDLP